MTLLDYTYDLFKGVKEKEYSFTYALNKKIQEMNLSSLEINIIKACLKGVINRYYYLKYEIKKTYGKVSEEQYDYLVLCLSYCRYVSNVNISDVLNFIKESESEHLKDLDLVKLQSSFEELKDNVKPVTPEIEKSFTKKLALQYSYPEWLVGMLKKHFGGKNTYKSIASSRRNTPINVVVNPQFDIEEVEKDESFKRLNLTSCSFEYVGKTPLIENQLFKEKKVYVMDSMEQLLVDQMEIHQGDEALVIGENKSMLVTTLALNMYNLGKIYYSCNNQDSYFNARKTFDIYKVKNVIPFEGDINLICTHAETNSLDKVLVIPPNSEFGLIRRKPEIAINFKQNELDSLIENQSRYLLEASRFVKEEGTLIYAVPTLNIKESYNIVRQFVEQNDEFVLEKEELIFPYVNQTTGLYYAKLIKKSNVLEEIKE